MSVYWNFRSILDVCPDESGFTCVGTTKKGKRCGQRMFSGSDLSCASRILDEMDAHKNYSSSYKYLEELAELTLCPRWHRKPGYSQVRSVTMRWQSEIAEHAAEIERKQRNRPGLKAPSKPPSCKASLPSPPSSPLHSNAALFDDSEREQSPLTTPTKVPMAKILPQTFMITTTSSIKVSATAKCSTVTPKVVSQEKTKIETFSFELPPTPDATPEPHIKDKTTSNATLLAYHFGAEKQDPIPTFDLAITTHVLSQEKTKIEAFKSGIPPTPDKTPEPGIKLESTKKVKLQASDLGAMKHTPLPTFDLGISSKLQPFVPLADGMTPARGDNQCFKTNGETSIFNFIPKYKIPSTSFNVSTPINYPSTEEDPFVLSSEVPSKQSTTPVKTAPSFTSSSFMSSGATPELPKYSSQELEESYGYATITTSSTRYKSYLPSPQQYGAATPPETLESRRDELQDAYLAFISDSPSSLAAVLREPLPSLLTLGACEGNLATCEACGVRGIQCGCGEDSEAETERIGCFRSLSLRKLHKTIIRKLNAIKSKVTGAVNRQSD